MNRLFMLNYLNNKFTSSSIKTKIELYLLPLLLLYLIYFIFSYSDKDSVDIKAKIKTDDYSNLEFKDSFLDLFSNIQDYASKNQIIIFNIANNKKIVSIKAKANLENMKSFLTKIENLNNFTNIKSFILNKQDLENYLFELQIDLNKFYIKKIVKQTEPADVKVNNELINKEKTIKYKINGIISDYAFINDSWFKKSEKIDDFILTKIERNFVILENENSKIILELNNEDDIKNLN
ncbi:MAG: hypothetical protein PHY66_11965 [Aliarcobacter sp.]|nr:hypothetical protein [Aliarcobacter sp.]